MHHVDENKKIKKIKKIEKIEEIKMLEERDNNKIDKDVM